MRTHRRGAILPLMSAVFTVFLIMAAFSINLARMQLTRTELKAATDAASRAGAEALARLDSTSAAVQAAIDGAAKNTVGNVPLTLTSDDVELGAVEQNQSGIWVFEAGETPTDSVQVNATASTSLTFSQLIGRSTFSPSATSTAAFVENEICLVVDRSHSMCFNLSGTDWVYPTGTGPNDMLISSAPADGSRWRTLESAIGAFLDTVAAVNSTQRVALVTWGSDITLQSYEGNLTGRTFPAAVIDAGLSTNLSPIRSAVLNRGQDIMLGGTNMTAGMQLGVSVLTGAGSHQFAKKTMILMTDGKWNQGNNPISTANNARAAGITIHTVTFLDAADQTDMKKVAKATGGTHYHASDAAALEDAFRELARNLPIVLTD
ncbi:MAG: VWA domain-containing protein [Planctomycetales bacterium]|nr:VWA domain-containing protein [Planctomycetales bacterium]